MQTPKGCLVESQGTPHSWRSRQSPLGNLPSATKPKHQNVNVLHCKKTHLLGKQLQVMLRFSLGMFIVLIVISHTVREKNSVCRDLHGRKTHLSTNCCVGTFSAEHTQEQWNRPESWHQFFTMRPVSTVKYHMNHM